VNLLAKLLDSREISPLSYHFAVFIADTADQNIDSLLAYSAALLSEVCQQGDVCLMLEQYHDVVLFESDRMGSTDLPVGPGLNDWCETLRASRPVGFPGDISPLILEHGRLYLHRFWRYETAVSDTILSRLGDKDVINETKLNAELDVLYPDKIDGFFEDQKRAVALSVKRRFTVICGGPGTGKTTIVVNILSVLLSQKPDLRIQLTAPTGKAAARLMESIRLGLERNQTNNTVAALFPNQASTIHRLLGYRKNGFRYSRQYLLPLDCLVVDEASMVDLPLMYRLLDALPGHTRIILLGDRNQLASVAAGNVFGDITGQGQTIPYSDKLPDYLEPITHQSSTNKNTTVGYTPQSPKIANSIALLTHSYRFASQQGIGQLAQRINRGQSEESIELLKRSGEQLEWLPIRADGLPDSTLRAIVDRYYAVISSATAEQALLAFEQFRVLCAVQSGAFGVKQMNRAIEDLMRTRQWISQEPNFRGQAILITANDYELELFNGDTGLLWNDENGQLKAYFKDNQAGQLRAITITNLPENLPAWSMTVHKSQGSEFDHVTLILPPDQPHSLTRELLYTGITRARRYLSIHASQQSIETACRKPSRRHSGLAAKLGWPDSAI